MNWQTIKDKLLEYWLVFSVIAIAILYFTLDRRTRNFQKIVSDLKEKAIESKIAALQEKAKQSEKDYEEAIQTYDSLKSKYADIVKRLGLEPPTRK
jgi:hypothetical protein